MLNIAHWFNRSKPFYPIIMTYVINLHAIKEVAILGLLGSKRVWELPAHIKGTDEERKLLQESVQKLLSPLQLLMTDETLRLEISIDEIAKEFTNEFTYLIDYQIKAAMHCLVMAHEITKDKPYRDNSPKWEFLRHCRNAIAHNGRFHLLNGEPRRVATWRSIIIEPSMHGQPLFSQPNGEGYLKIGDPIALLAEIENDFPNIIL